MVLIGTLMKLNCNS